MIELKVNEVELKEKKELLGERLTALKKEMKEVEEAISIVLEDWSGPDSVMFGAQATDAVVDMNETSDTLDTLYALLSDISDAYEEFAKKCSSFAFEAKDSVEVKETPKAASQVERAAVNTTKSVNVAKPDSMTKTNAAPSAAGYKQDLSNTSFSKPKPGFTNAEEVKSVMTDAFMDTTDETDAEESKFENEADVLEGATDITDIAMNHAQNENDRRQRKNYNRYGKGRAANIAM